MKIKFIVYLCGPWQICLCYHDCGFSVVAFVTMVTLAHEINMKIEQNILCCVYLCFYPFVSEF